MARVSKRRLAKFETFMKWVQSDPAIKAMASGVCRERGFGNIGELPQKDPKAFDELYELAKDFREQAPPEERPGFLR